MELMPDNLAEIRDNFECKVDARFADGYAYFCQHCGLECNVGEAGFDCQGGEIFPVIIVGQTILLAKKHEGKVNSLSQAMKNEKLHYDRPETHNT